MYTCGERSGCNRSISGQPDLQRISGWLTQIFPHMRNKPIQNRGFEWVSCACVKIFVSTNLKSSVCKYVRMYCGTIVQGAIGQAAQEWWLCCVWAEPPYNRSGCNRSGCNRSGCPGVVVMVCVGTGECLGKSRGFSVKVQDYVRMCTYVYVCVHMCMYVYVCVRMCTYVYVCVRMCVYLLQ